MIQVKTTYGSLFSRLAGRKDDVIKLDTPTLNALLQVLIQKYSQAFTEAIADPKTGELLPGTAVLVNGVSVFSRDSNLKDGDEVAFIISFAGG